MPTILDGKRVAKELQVELKARNLEISNLR